jgi:hypothetical protein
MEVCGTVGGPLDGISERSGPYKPPQLWSSTLIPEERPASEMFALRSGTLREWF